MGDYTELAKSLRICAMTDDCIECKESIEINGKLNDCGAGYARLMVEAADAIEELLHAAKKMHTWIFLNTWDEQKAYDECGLSDEMNAALGYGGQLEIKVNDDV